MVGAIIKFRVTGFTIVSVDVGEGETVLNRRAKAVHSVLNVIHVSAQSDRGNATLSFV